MWYTTPYPVLGLASASPSAPASVSSTSSRRLRQYVGLALVVLAYVGGIIGWTWAVQTVDPPPSAPRDSTAVTAPAPGSTGPAAVPAAARSVSSPER